MVKKYFGISIVFKLKVKELKQLILKEIPST